MFWRLTFREIDNILAGVVMSRRRQHDERAWSAWMTARLTAYAPKKAKDFVKLKALLHDAKPQRKQSVAEQVSVAMQWSAALARR